MNKHKALDKDKLAILKDMITNCIAILDEGADFEARLQAAIIASRAHPMLEMELLGAFAALGHLVTITEKAKRSVTESN